MSCVQGLAAAVLSTQLVPARACPSNDRPPPKDPSHAGTGLLSARSTVSSHCLSHTHHSSGQWHWDEGPAVNCLHSLPGLLQLSTRATHAQKAATPLTLRRRSACPAPRMLSVRRASLSPQRATGPAQSGPIRSTGRLTRSTKTLALVVAGASSLGAGLGASQHHKRVAGQDFHDVIHAHSSCGVGPRTACEQFGPAARSRCRPWLPTSRRVAASTTVHLAAIQCCAVPCCAAVQVPVPSCLQPDPQRV